jgi:hypothetical protein
MKALKSVLLFLALLSSVIVHSRDIVVLTSLETPDRQPFWRSRSYEISRTIEKRMRRHLKGHSDNIIFKHNASAADLKRYLTASTTSALFWVSHAVNQDEDAIGVGRSSMVLDVFGNDVSSIFQKIHPNVQFVSLVGCQGLPILNRYRELGAYESNRDLTIHGFRRNVSLRKGLRQAAAAARNRLGRPRQAPTSLITSHTQTRTIYVESHHDDDYVGVLMVGEHYLGLLRPNQGLQEFNLNTSLIKNQKAKLTINWLTLRELDELHWPGALDVMTSEMGESQRYFSDWNGLIYGGRRNLYYLFWP